MKATLRVSTVLASRLKCQWMGVGRRAISAESTNASELPFVQGGCPGTARIVSNGAESLDCRMISVSDVFSCALTCPTAIEPAVKTKRRIRKAPDRKVLQDGRDKSNNP